jgi:hypothetical protein
MVCSAVGGRTPVWTVPEAQLGILPGLTHYNIGSSLMLATVVTPFLDSRIGVA